MLKVVNESSALTIGFDVRDPSANELMVPTTIDWRLYCLTNDQSVTDWVAIVSPAATNELSISGDDNAIINDANAYEDRVLLLRIDEGLDTQEYRSINYRVKNLPGVP